MTNRLAMLKIPESSQGNKFHLSLPGKFSKFTISTAILSNFIKSLKVLSRKFLL